MSRGGEQGLLAHGGGVGDVGDGDEAAVFIIGTRRVGRGRGSGGTEEDVERRGGGEERGEVREVGVEGGGGGPGGEGDEGFVPDAGEEAPLGGVGCETVEGGQELGRCYARRMEEFSMEQGGRNMWTGMDVVPVMPDCILRV